MDRKTLNRIGLAAAILLVPGGFILGATLAARRYRQQAEESEADVTPTEVATDDSAASSSDDIHS